MDDNIVIISKNDDTIKTKICNENEFLRNEIIKKKDKTDDIKIFDDIMKYMVKNLNNVDKSCIGTLMSKIIEAKSNEDLYLITLDFLSFYVVANDSGKITDKNNNSKKIIHVRNVLNSYREYAIDKIITGIIDNYFNNAFLEYDVKSIKDFFVNFQNYNDCIKLLPFNINDDNKDEFTENLHKRIFSSFYRCAKELITSTNLCCLCSNGYPEMCEKVEDRFFPYAENNDEKKTIDMYDSITDGLQILHKRPIDENIFYEDNTKDCLLIEYYVNTFAVHECDGFKPYNLSEFNDFIKYYNNYFKSWANKEREKYLSKRKIKE